MPIVPGMYILFLAIVNELLLGLLNIQSLKYDCLICLLELPPIPTLPPQPERFLPLVESLSPSLLQQLQSGFLDQVKSQTKLTGGGKSGHIPGIPGKDYPDFKTIPHTEFSCENFILEGFYADTFTSCQVRD